MTCVSLKTEYMHAGITLVISCCKTVSSSLSPITVYGMHFSELS